MNNTERKENSAIDGTWDELQKEIFTAEEIEESNLKVALIGELLKAKQEKSISQEKYTELVTQLEENSESQQIDTILKILVPLGKTLAIVPLENNK